VDRYSFTVWLFHPLHPAGFSGAPGFRLKIIASPLVFG